MRTRKALLAMVIGVSWSATSLAAPPALSFEEEAAAAAGKGSTPAPDSPLAVALRGEGCAVLNSFALGPGHMRTGGALDQEATTGSTAKLETVVTVDSMGQVAYATCAGHNVVLNQHVRVDTPTGGRMSSEVRMQTISEADGLQLGRTRSGARHLVVWRDAEGVQHSLTYEAVIDEATAHAVLMPLAQQVSQHLR